MATGEVTNGVFKEDAMKLSRKPTGRVMPGRPAPPLHVDFDDGTSCDYCPVCGSGALACVKCKVVCGNCGQLIENCAGD